MTMRQEGPPGSAPPARWAPRLRRRPCRAPRPTPDPGCAC